MGDEVFLEGVTRMLSVGQWLDPFQEDRVSDTQDKTCKNLIYTVLNTL